MKKILLPFFAILITTSLFAQRQVQRDTIFMNGTPLGVPVTNWYCIEGDECPQFIVNDENGKEINSEDLRGKTVVVSFWISTCKPCLKELGRVGPEMIDVYPSDKFAFIAIGDGETAESAKSFRSRSNATFPLCYDESGEVFKKFADNGYPKLFVIDKNGIVRLKEKGYNDEKFSHLKDVVETLLKE